MKELYPFINFIFKTKQQKGHPKSMNFIFELVKTRYIFNIEDDWEFFIKDNYITRCLNIFNNAKCTSTIGQVLLNLNYTEDTNSAINIWGSKMKYTKFNQRYFIHTHYENQL